MGSGQGKNRRIRSIADGGQDDIFHDVEGWCLHHPDPQERQTLQGFLGRSQGLEVMKRKMQLMGGTSRHEINREIAKMVSEQSPVEEAWGGILTTSDDPRVIAAHAIVMARSHVGKLAYLLDDCIDRVDSPQMREAIAFCYGCLGDPATRPRLEELAQGEDEFVSNAAAWSLKQLPSDEVAEELLIDDFNDFLSSTSATDFARFDHYNEGAEEE